MAALDGAIPAIIGAANAAGGSFQIDRSLRFNSGDSSKLTRTFNASNRKTFTYSCWVKRTQTGTKHSLFHAGSTYYRFDSGDDLYFYHPQGNVNTDALFRDPSAWYHIVLAVDTTQSTAANRVKIYVNGTLAGLSGTYPNQNVDVDINSAAVHTIGSQSDFDVYLNGYLAEVQFLDGTAVSDASDFGEYDSNNVWQPKQYAGTYGSNGFYLKFADNSSNAALGTDSSGNSNTWTVNNINAASQTSSTGSSWYFNGTSANCSVDDSSIALGSGDYTVEYFLKPDTGYNAQSTHYNGMNGNSPNFETDGATKFRLMGGSTYGPTLSAGSWYHCAVVRENGACTMWVNGTRVAHNIAHTTNYTNTKHIMGARSDNNVDSTYTKGWLSNIHVIVGTAKYSPSSSTINIPLVPIATHPNTKLLALHASTMVDGSGQNLTITNNGATVSNDLPSGGAAGSPLYSDSMIDSPTNYDDGTNVGGNYATLNPLNANLNSTTISQGNLTWVKTSASVFAIAYGTIGINSGKYYYEVTVNNYSGNFNIGWNNAAGGPFADADTNAAFYSLDGGVIRQRVNTTSSTIVASGKATSTGIIGMAIDCDNNTVSFYHNNSLQHTVTGMAADTYFPRIYVDGGGNASNVDFNFGQRPFAYTPPTGYLSLCTQNLADPTIADGSTAFNATLYTGNGSARDISTPYGPDFVWIKSRSATYDHGAFDVLRGANQRLNINSNGAEGTEANSVTAFNSDSFSLGSLAFYNNPSTTFVAWNWNAGTSTGSNTDGSITSQVRANASAGFSIVTYTGNGTAGATIGHGLNAEPGFVVFKSRSASGNWLTYHKSLGGNYYLFLESTAAQVNLASTFGVSSSTLTVQTYSNYNASGTTYIAYCFAPVEGYSAFGKYTGNGSSDGPFVYTGFRVAWLMIKNTSTSGETWTIYDSTRDVDNTAKQRLQPNSSDAESVGSSARFKDLLSNGFKIRGTSGEQNTNGDTYIYAAFAEHPFKTARAR
jgi:hypothetical protein